MKHLVSVTDLTKSDALELLDLALQMESVNQMEAKKIPALKNTTVVNLFFEDSTRTKLSFEIAAKRLSAEVINFTAKGSSMSKGESLKDTVLTLEAMGADAFIVRHSQSGAAQTIAESWWSNASIVNAGDGTHEHPTQALLDAFTIRQRLVGGRSTGDLAGIKVLIVGDILHSRVARSNAILLRMLGATVAFCGPATLLPNGFSSLVDQTFHDLDEALESRFEVVMMLRIQQERMTSAFIPNANEYSKLFGLNLERFKLLDSKTVIMHPGPMNRGLEIASEVADSKQSAIVAQVSNGVSIRMAVLHKLLAKEGKL
ncbi:MAG: aspartate carbamoyltransferase catalytic subunit [Micrococcales bacterium]|nr:aspartate carbamoyltransferase catalytic subunit [Micrococcales bacterium]